MDMAEYYGGQFKNWDAEYQKYLDSNGEDGITKADYITGLTDTYNDLLGELTSLNEKTAANREYYGQFLDAKIEELTEYYDKMDHLKSVLSHYENILKLTGQEEDYAKIGEVLES
jgi:hypothetical protein